MKKDKVGQARANAIKVVRTAIRLKHALAADEELNQVLPVVVAEFNKSVQQGELPDPLTVLEALRG